MIFADTNVVPEAIKSTPDANVLNWLRANDSELAISTIVIGEISFGIEIVRMEQRSKRYQNGLLHLRKRYAKRIYGFDEESALLYGTIMGKANLKGVPMSTADGMIAAIALRHGAPLATRNGKNFVTTGAKIINPWDFAA